MRFFKNTVAWVIVLLVLSGVFYFFDEKVTQVESEMAAKRRLFAFSVEDVSSFDIKKGDSLISANKGKDGWLLLKPLISYGDQKAIEEMLKHTVNANIDGVLFDETAPDKLKEMGLDPAYISITLRTSSGAIASLSLGDRGPTQNVAFATLEGDKRLLRVHADVRAEIDRETYDLRDKTVIAIDPEKLRKVEIVWKEGNSINIHHSTENRWDAEGLPYGRTDLTKLLGSLYAIKEAKAKAFVDESPRDLSLYGLDSPRLKIRFIDSNNILQTLLVGSKDKKRRGFYALRGGEDNVILLEEDFLDHIPDEVADLQIVS